MTPNNRYDELSEEDLNEVFPLVASETQGLPKKEFQQWHLPRKQFVRIHQWCAEVRALARDLVLNDTKPFNYLTLPGDDLLDIRALMGVMERAGSKLRYLGFNAVSRGSIGQREMNISRSEVRSSGLVDDFSHIEEDRLETLSNPKSASYRRLIELGHCHAINLDFCRSLSHGDIEEGALGAIRSILNHQLNSTQPWLLFVTTKVEPHLIEEHVKSGFDNAISANIEANEEFKRSLAELFATEPAELKQRTESAWAADGDDLLRIFTLGFSKWLLRTLVGDPPTRSLKLKSAYFYRSGDLPNMISLAFRCDSTIPMINDRDGVFAPITPQTMPSEEQLGLEILASTSSIIDLDRALYENQVLNEKMTEKSIQLLAQARYSANEYPIWLEQNRFEFTQPLSA